MLTLSEYVLDLDLGLDQLLFKESSGAVRTSHLGRMSPVTALNFVLVGCALLLLETNRGILPGQYLAIGAAISSLIALVGYAYGEESLYSLSVYTSMALHTSVTFLILCFGILYAHPTRGLMSVVNGENTGSALTRRLLPFVILAPLVGGWLRIKGQDAGLYGTGFGTALFAVTLMLIFVAVIGWTARSLSRSDEKRMWAEEALRRAHDELEARVQERTAEIVKKTRDLEQERAHAREAEASLRESEAHTRRIVETALDAFIGMDAAGVITDWNVQAEQMFGWPRQEAIGRLLSATIIPAQHREAHERGLRHFLATGEGPILNTRVEITGCHRDGHEFPIELAISPALVQEGSLHVQRVRAGYLDAETDGRAVGHAAQYDPGAGRVGDSDGRDAEDPSHHLRSLPLGSWRAVARERERTPGRPSVARRSGTSLQWKRWNSHG